MAIVSSAIVRDDAQANLSRKVHEAHTDHRGVIYWVRYVAAQLFDANGAMLARVPQIDAHLVEIETARNIERILAGLPASALTTEFVTVADMRQALRDLYQTGAGEDVGRLATFLLSLSDANLRTLFNIVQNQVAALRARLQTRADELDAVLTAVGE